MLRYPWGLLVAASLALLLGWHIPWRLLALAGEVWVLQPGPVQLTGLDTGYWTARRLTVRIERLGWTVIYTPLPAGILGQADRAAHQIEIDTTLHWTDRAAVLAHEAGHILAPAWLPDDDSEVFAEAVALLVVHDGVREHARYLAGHPASTLWALLATWRPITHAASVLTD